MIISTVLLKIDYRLWLSQQTKRSRVYYSGPIKFVLEEASNLPILERISIKLGKPSTTNLERSFLTLFQNYIHIRGITNIHHQPIPFELIIGSFIESISGTVRGKQSKEVYLRVITYYGTGLRYDISKINKRSANSYINESNILPATRRLYLSIIKRFVGFLLNIVIKPTSEIIPELRSIKKLLEGKNEATTLRSILQINLKKEDNPGRQYHKDPLTREERDTLIKNIQSIKDKAIIVLMTINGFRPIEVTRLLWKDVYYHESQIGVQGTGKTEKQKDIIRMFNITAKCLKAWESNAPKKNVVFPELTPEEISSISKKYLNSLNIKKPRHVTAESLRHTAGQLMFDSGISLEFIQQTLRHSSLNQTMKYAAKNIELNYLKKMPKNY